MPSEAILNYIKRIKNISHLGLTYTRDVHDIERYHELEQISLEMKNLITDQPLETLSSFC